MSRKQTPDLLSQLMVSNNKTVEQESNKEIKQKNLSEIKLVSNKINENLKEKTTFNLSISTLDKLETTWLKLRKKLRDKTKITKTLIVERAIELAISDFEKNHEASALFENIINEN